jgi:hypothetical protein
MVNEGIALRLQVSLDLGLGLFRGLVRHETQVQRDLGIHRYGIGGLRPHVARTQAADVDGRTHEAIGEPLGALAATYLQFLLQARLRVRKCSERPGLGRGQRAHAIHIARDQNLAFAVPEGGHDLGRHDRRVRHPVAVVAAVHGLDGAVDGDLDRRIPTRTEVELRPAALVHGAITDDPEVGLQEILVGAQDRFEVR